MHALTYALYPYLHIMQLIQQQDPRQFTCNIGSPVGPEVWSNTQPPVSLTHIFCGQINNAGQATGVHGLGTNSQPSGAGVVRLQSACPSVGRLNMPCWRQTDVWNNRTIQFVRKLNPSNSAQLFYPGSFENTVNYLTTLYNNLNNVSNPSCQRLHPNNNRYCFLVYYRPSINTLDHKTVLQMNANNNNIRSAWPLPPNRQPGYCTLGNTCRVTL